MTKIHGIWEGSPHPPASLVLASSKLFDEINVINDSIHIKNI